MQGWGKGLAMLLPLRAEPLSMFGLLQVHAGRRFADVLSCRSRHGDVVSCAPPGAAVGPPWAVSMVVLPPPEHSGQDTAPSEQWALPCSALELVHLTVV